MQETLRQEKVPSLTGHSNPLHTSSLALILSLSRFWSCFSNASLGSDIRLLSHSAKAQMARTFHLPAARD